MQKKIRGFLRVIGAGIAALIALELCCRIYFNKPIHYTDPDGATDYKWEADTFYSNWTEGFGYGKTNNEGYYCWYDYQEGMDIDVLVMGSSFMMAEQVPQTQSAAYLLSTMLPDKTVYNIGTAGHYFLNNIQNLSAAIDKYSPEYVIIDTQYVEFPDEELEQVLSGTLPELESTNSGLSGIIQRSCLARLLYYQFSFYSDEHGGLIHPPELKPLFAKTADSSASVVSDVTEGETDGNTNEDTDNDDTLNNRLMQEMLYSVGKLTKEKNVRLIILFHPKTWLDENGNVWVTDAPKITGFDELCEQNGILLVDMSDRYMQEFGENRVLPYGFSNTEIGSGHLNAKGHVMVAEELYKAIEEVD